MPEINLKDFRLGLEKKLADPKLPKAVRQRIRFLLLWDSGAPLELLASDLQMSERTVSRWKNLFHELRCNDLDAVPKFILESRSRGRPARAKELFLSAMAKVPPTESLGSVCLARRIKMSERTVRRLMAGMRRRPDKTLILA